MIDAALAQFLQEGLGIHVGTRNERLEPNGARAVAVHVEPDGAHVVVYFAKVAAKRILADLEANGQAAVTFARPPDERACQVKGVYVSARAARPNERAGVLAQWGAFLDKLETIGIPRANVAGWVSWPAIAIRLKVTALFDQTPGPQAGTALS